MKEKLIRHFAKITPLSTDEIKALEDSMVIKEYKKDSFLLREGQRGEDSFFVLDGLVRQYKMLNEEEITTDFFSEDQWIISLNDFIETKPADNYLICMEDTTVVVGNEEMAQVLFKYFPRFETISRMVMEKIFEEKQRFMSSYITDTPEQRYVRLLEARPDILQRVPQYHIATFIGVKPESLSRIRRRLSNS